MSTDDFTSLEALNAALTAELHPSPRVGRAVPGEGPRTPPLALVGEQPGDAEDRIGRPFVGPAGHLLDQALAEAGVARADIYLTNAVKQFHFAERGMRRLHRKPSAAEVVHARWWLTRELDLVRPRLVVALGATAAFALAGRPVAVMRERGPHELSSRPGYVTLHPSALLRMPDAAARREAFARFVADLDTARRLAG